WIVGHESAGFVELDAEGLPTFPRRFDPDDCLGDRRPHALDRLTILQGATDKRHRIRVLGYSRQNESSLFAVANRSIEGCENFGSRTFYLSYAFLTHFRQFQCDTGHRVHLSAARFKIVSERRGRRFSWFLSIGYC